MAKFRLNFFGGGQVLRELFADEIAALAQKVANTSGPDAVMELSTLDRSRATVSVPADQQAKDGVLTRSAVNAGLQIRLK